MAAAWAMAAGGCHLPQPLLHLCPPVCAHPTTFHFHLSPLLIVKSPLAAGDCQHRYHPCRPCCPCHCRSCLHLHLRLRLHLCLCLPPAGCRGARRRTSCWRGGVSDDICSVRPSNHHRCNRAGGRRRVDDLEPPMAAAWATVATPAVIVCHDHRCA